nr:sulfotransferase [uncultured Allomuricauda sp.]
MNIIYLLGAGRSGTTLLATVLNANKNIVTVGEMHQFGDYLVEDKKCSCGEHLEKCSFWGSIMRELENVQQELRSLNTRINKKENHRNIPYLLFKKKPDSEYLSVQEKIFEKTHKQCTETYLLDSSKYVARYLLLSRSSKLKVKGLYVTRDVRGVVNSFSKNVQTTKKPVATILYYLLINFFAQIVAWSDKRVLKVRYEDFVEDPLSQLSRIQLHIFGEEDKQLTLSEEIKMPHIIGGNRMKHNKKINIYPDYKWKKSLNRKKQVLYYLVTLPFMVINRYKI